MVQTFGWGLSLSLVWAENEEDAKKVVYPNGCSFELEVTELEAKENGILWSYDSSPDSPREVE
jgi:hypothetical protein